MDLHPYEVLRRPKITEKNTMLMEQGKYTFEVHQYASKQQIKDAVALLMSPDSPVNK